MKNKSNYFPIVLASFIVVIGVGSFVLHKKGVVFNSPVVNTNDPDSMVKPVIKEDAGYHRVTLGESKVGAELTQIVGKEHLSAVLSLNRLDIKHLQPKQEIIIPDSFDDPFALSSFPRYVPDLASIPKIILVDQRIQEFGVYENGSLVRSGGVSTGKKSTQTPSKLYHTNWKGKLVTSTVDDEWIMPWYFNLENFEGISMHQYELPGYPASHSCVRLSEEDAIWMYNWADQWVLSDDKSKVVKNGNPVIIFGKYDYNAKAPWKNLPEDKYAMRLTIEDIQKAISPYWSEITKN